MQMEENGNSVLVDKMSNFKIFIDEIPGSGYHKKEREKKERFLYAFGFLLVSCLLLIGHNARIAPAFRKAIYSIKISKSL